jgi:hypothetical protein
VKKIAPHYLSVFLSEISANSVYDNIFSSLREAERRGNPDFKFCLNLSTGLPRRFTPRNDEMKRKDIFQKLANFLPFLYNMVPGGKRPRALQINKIRVFY